MLTIKFDFNFFVGVQLFCALLQKGFMSSYNGVYVGWQCEVPAAPQAKAAYEQWYNSGCAAVAGGHLEEGSKRLETALKECAAALKSEKAPQEEIDQEQAIIRWD